MNKDGFRGGKIPKMNNIKIARNIVTGYLNRAGLQFEDKVVEIAAVMENDEYLLEHINMMLEVLNKAKEELEGNSGKDE